MNVHHVIANRAVHPVHAGLADLQSSEDGLTHVQRRAWGIERRMKY